MLQEGGALRNYLIPSPYLFIYLFYEKEADPEKLYNLFKVTQLLSHRAVSGTPASPVTPVLRLCSLVMIEYLLEFPFVSLGVWIDVCAQAGQTTAQHIKQSRAPLHLLFENANHGAWR